MPGRKQPHDPNDTEAYHEYRLRERIERGEKVTGAEADWLDRRGAPARVARRDDAQRRHEKPRGPRGA